MMSVQEYAEEMGFVVQDVLNKCQELGIKASSKDDMLDDEAIIILDNCMNLISADEDLDFDEQDAIDEVVDDIISTIFILQLFICPVSYESTFTQTTRSSYDQLVLLPVLHPVIKHLEILIVANVVQAKLVHKGTLADTLFF